MRMWYVMADEGFNTAVPKDAWGKKDEKDRRPRPPSLWQHIQRLGPALSLGKFQNHLGGPHAEMAGQRIL